MFINNGGIMSTYVLNPILTIIVLISIPACVFGTTSKERGPQELGNVRAVGLLITQKFLEAHGGHVPCDIVYDISETDATIAAIRKIEEGKYAGVPFHQAYKTGWAELVPGRYEIRITQCVKNIYDRFRDEKPVFKASVPTATFLTVDVLEGKVYVVHSGVCIEPEEAKQGRRVPIWDNLAHIDTLESIYVQETGIVKHPTSEGQSFKVK